MTSLCYYTHECIWDTVDLDASGGDLIYEQFFGVQVFTCSRQTRICNYVDDINLLTLLRQAQLLFRAGIMYSLFKYLLANKDANCSTLIGPWIRSCGKLVRGNRRYDKLMFDQRSAAICCLLGDVSDVITKQDNYHLLV